MPYNLQIPVNPGGPIWLWLCFGEYEEGRGLHGASVVAEMLIGCGFPAFRGLVSGRRHFSRIPYMVRVPDLKPEGGRQCLQDVAEGACR